MTDLSSGPLTVASPTSATPPPVTPAVAAAPPYHAALGALRGAITVLVLVHHALLAYHPFAPPPGPSLLAMQWWRAFPVVDAERWSAATWIVGCNDTFFMSLMFLLAGLFAWPSLVRKGSWRHTRERWRRLGLPLVVASLVLAPLAYIPSYLQTGAPWSLSGFWSQWSALDSWPTGPAWFLVVLLAFDLGALGLFVITGSGARPPRGGDAAAPPGRLPALARSPALIFAVLIAASAAAYLPLALRYGAGHWTTLGPLAFQTSRIGHYAVYFFLGLALGAWGAERGALAADGALARRWYVWNALAPIAFLVSVVATVRTFTAGADAARWNLVAGGAFVIACATLCLAVTSLFLRFVQGRGRGWGSLSRSAYGMYVMHYPVVSWLQYALLGAALAGWTKAVLVIGGAVALTWSLMHASARRA